jgi:hypothetical protein
MSASAIETFPELFSTAVAFTLKLAVSIVGLKSSSVNATLFSIIQ